MNVSKGDIAITVGTPQNGAGDGLICEVLEFIGHIPNYERYGLAWKVRLQRAINAKNSVVEDYRKITDVIGMPDMYLRRICPPLDESVPDPVAQEEPATGTIDAAFNDTINDDLKQELFI